MQTPLYGQAGDISKFGENPAVKSGSGPVECPTCYQLLGDQPAKGTKQEFDIAVDCFGLANWLTQASTGMSFAVEGPISSPNPCAGFCILNGCGWRYYPRFWSHRRCC
jgi:hypothetical protein